MSIKKITLTSRNLFLLSVAALSIPAVQAAAPDAGHGTVTFIGSIVDAPCSIAQGDDNQVVRLGQISQASLGSEGVSTPRPFTIELENCVLSTEVDEEGNPVKANTVSVTFSGTPDAVDSTMLGLNGQASGAGIVISDGSGKVVPLGTASKATAFQEGDSNTLAFSAYLKGEKDVSTITPGAFSSVANFTLAYQ